MTTEKLIIKYLFDGKTQYEIAGRLKMDVITLSIIYYAILSLTKCGAFLFAINFPYF